jgi:hypothetical protein
LSFDWLSTQDTKPFVLILSLSKDRSMNGPPDTSWRGASLALRLI